jgi:hypothetical protein
LSDTSVVNKDKIFGTFKASTTLGLSSRSNRQGTENGSQNKRYESNNSYGSSPSVGTGDDNEKDQLAKMIHQSFVKRSTDFDGKSAPSFTDNKSVRRRPSSAKSRESFFIPYIFKKGENRNLTLFRN